MRAKNGRSSSTLPKGSSRAPSVSSTDVQSTPRVILPNDIATSLRYLDNPELQRLLAAVRTEITRRNQEAAAATTSQPVETHKTTSVDEVPEGKANLIRASFGAGLKPAAIARMFRVSPSLVNRIIRSAEKAKG